MQYPHWLMVAGAVLVAIGFIGLAFRRNRDGPHDEGHAIFLPQLIRGESRGEPSRRFGT
jgi:hypothetical protein